MGMHFRVRFGNFAGSVRSCRHQRQLIKSSRNPQTFEHLLQFDCRRRRLETLSTVFAAS